MIFAELWINTSLFWSN